MPSSFACAGVVRTELGRYMVDDSNKVRVGLLRLVACMGAGCSEAAVVMSRLAGSYVPCQSVVHAPFQVRHIVVYSLQWWMGPAVAVASLFFKTPPQVRSHVKMSVSVV